MSASTLAVASPAPIALALTFGAGALTSIGPCVAPRYIAIAALANASPRPIVPTLIFVGGLVFALMALGFGAGALGTLWTSCVLLYPLLAIALVVMGCVTLVRAEPRGAARTACCPRTHAASGRNSVRSRSLGGVFLLGAASALVVSPCCTPVVAAIAATCTAIGKPLLGAVLLASFALGHALPLFFAGSIAALVRRVTRLHVIEQGAAIVSGSLMLTLGAYYGVLA